MSAGEPNWAVERDVFPGDEEDRLIRALEARGIEFHEFTGDAFRMDSLLAEVSVPRGSCFFVREMSRSRSWLPALWGTPEHFNCSFYFPLLAPWLVSSEHRLLSFGELCWTHPQCTAELGDATGNLFIRPDDGFKTFEGAVVPATQFDSWRKTLQVLQVPSHIQVLIARPVRIRSEWRILMMGGRAVAASQYRPVKLAGAPPSVLGFAEKIHRESRWSLQAYALDLAETETGLRVVEAGCLLCLAFYEADVAAIVDALQPLVQNASNESSG